LLQVVFEVILAIKEMKDNYGVCQEQVEDMQVGSRLGV
jgi:hypothetical protein